MANVKVTTATLSSELRLILSEYGYSVTDDLKAAVQDAAKMGAKAVKAGAKEKFIQHSGRYARGWTARTEIGRVSARAVIYNSQVPGLPHLLEYGHAKRGGGRVPGRPHIKPVEETMVTAFEKELEAKLR